MAQSFSHNPVSTLSFEIDPLDGPTSGLTANSALVIDNGSFRCKAGIAATQLPCLCFPPVCAKNEFTSRPSVLVGNECQDLLPLGPASLKTPFSKNVVSEFVEMEQCFDYLFDSLGVSSQIDCPVLLTEPFCNPSLSRNAVAELLFETYRVQSLTFAVDFLLSNLFNSFRSTHRKNAALFDPSKVDAFLRSHYRKQSNCIVSAGQEFSYVASVLDGQVSFRDTFRIPVGGKTSQVFLREALQRKSPPNPPPLSERALFRAMSRLCAVSSDFEGDLRRIERSPRPSTTASISGRALLSSGDDLRRDSAEILLDHCVGFCAEVQAGASSSEKMDLSSFREVQVARQFVQVFDALLWKSKNLSIEYAAFLRMIKKFGADSEEAFVALKSSLQSDLARCEELYPVLKQQTSVCYDRVKTRERSRIQRTSNSKKLRVMAEIESLSSDSNTKFWNGPELIMRNISSGEDLDAAISELLQNRKNSFQADLSAEQIQTPEVFFQPNLTGFFHLGGIGDAISQNVAKSPKMRSIFVTGGASKIKGFGRRVEAEAVKSFPAEQKVSVSSAADPVFDAWKGGRLFSLSKDFAKSLSFRRDYEESGFDRLFQPHLFSNQYPEAGHDLSEENEF